MPFSEVPRIELNPDGTVTFFVNIGGFRVGTPVEISGNAVQTNGSTATFRVVRMMTEGDPGEGVIVVVQGVPVMGSAFTVGDPIMVVTSAADVWVTKLNQATGTLSPAILAAKRLSDQIGSDVAWNSDGATYHSLYSTTSGQLGTMWQKAPDPPSS